MWLNRRHNENVSELSEIHKNAAGENLMELVRFCVIGEIRAVDRGKIERVFRIACSVEIR